jgi:hypothetical protein
MFCIHTAVVVLLYKNCGRTRYVAGRTYLTVGMQMHAHYRMQHLCRYLKIHAERLKTHNITVYNT